MTRFGGQLLVDFKQERLDSPSMYGILEEAVSLCRARAEVLGRPALLRVHTSISVADPWSLLPMANTPWIGWYDGKDGSCLAGLGSLQTVDIEGVNCLERAGEMCATILEGVVDAGEVTLGCHSPVLLAGLGFVPDGDALRGAWQGWPRNQLVVPKTLVIRPKASRSSGSIAILAARIGADSPIDFHVHALTQRLNLLKKRANRAAEVVSPATVGPWDPRALENQSSWEGRVDEVLQGIASETLRKVVLARATEFETDEVHTINAMETARTLRRQHPGSYCFAYGRADGSVFVGASPETLVRIQSGEIRTHALAGTIARGRDAAEDDALSRALLDSAKDRAEQAMVVTAIHRALEPFCSHVHVPDSPRVKRLAQMQHLMTPITGGLREHTNILRIVERLHPSPAVGGWPSDAAALWLGEHEGMERGWYGGPIGWVDAKGEGVFAVAIRSALLRERRATAYVGAGIVADSQPVLEWHETELKLRTIMDALRQSEVSP